MYFRLIQAVNSLLARRSFNAQAAHGGGGGGGGDVCYVDGGCGGGGRLTKACSSKLQCVCIQLMNAKRGCTCSEVPPPRSSSCRKRVVVQQWLWARDACQLSLKFAAGIMGSAKRRSRIELHRTHLRPERQLVEMGAPAR